MNLYRISILLLLATYGSRSMGMLSRSSSQSSSQKRTASQSSLSFEERPLKMTSLERCDSALHPLVRLNSTNPSVEAFKQALVAGDLDTVRARIGIFPFCLYRQYLLLGLVQSSHKEVLACILDTIFERWVATIKRAPGDGIDQLLAGIKRIKQAYGDQLDHGFMQMIENVRITVLDLDKVKSNRALYERAQEIPHYPPSENLLQVQAAYYVSPDTPDLPEHIRELIARARHDTDHSLPVNSEKRYK